MEKLFGVVGGRKMFLVILFMLFVAFKKFLDIDIETLKWLAGVVIGGAGAIAIDDFGKSKNEPGAPPTT